MDPTLPPTCPPGAVPAVRSNLIRQFCLLPPVASLVEAEVSRAEAYARTSDAQVLVPGGRPGEGEVYETLFYRGALVLHLDQWNMPWQTAVLPAETVRRYRLRNDWTSPDLSALAERPDGERRLYAPSVNTWNPAAPPCLVGVHLLPRADRLSVGLYLRSSNAAAELFLDLLHGAHFLLETAALAGYLPGVLYFAAGSLHVHAAGETFPDPRDWGVT